MNPSPNIPASNLQGAGDDRLALDADQMNHLSIYHYIVGGLVVLMSCMFMAVIVMGMDQLEFNPDHQERAWLLMILGSLGIIGGWILACVIMLTGYYIAQRRRRGLTLAIAIINLLLFPFGTLLGICTLVILRRDSIRLLYGRGEAPPRKM